MLPEFNGHAIPQMDLEYDRLVECELCDPLGGDPATWPECPWIDGEVYNLGPALTPDETIPDPVPTVYVPPSIALPESDTPDHGTPDQLPGEEIPLDPTQPDPDDTGDFEELAPEDEDLDQAAKTWEPDPEDIADYLEPHPL